VSWKDKFPEENKYFETNDGILYCSDVVKQLSKFPDESIDLVITSPPYDNLRYYFAKDKKELENIWNFEKFKVVAKELYRIVKKGSIVVWIVGDATINGSETGNSFRQALYFKDECGFNLHDTMIYDKGSCPFPEVNRYYQCFEYMFILSKGKPKTVNLIRDRLNKRANEVIKATTNRLPDGSLVKTSAEKNKTGRRIKYYGVRFNIWKISPGWKKSHTDDLAYRHPATFPEQLAHDHIISWSNKGDIVLDPLCGSGTVLKMSEKLSRRWIGIEINPEYCEIAKQRILKEIRQLEIELKRN